MEQFAILIPAAGRSSRFAVAQNKLHSLINTKSVLARSIEAFLGRSDVAEVVVAVSDDQSVDEARPKLPSDVLRLIEGNERITLCAGGECRAKSVRNALQAIRSNASWVAVHDAARPLVTSQLIDRVFTCAVQRGAAAPAVPVKYTVKLAGTTLPSKIERTIPRENLWLMQTPQAARRSDLLDAYEACPLPLESITDDVQLLELAGRPVWLTEGDEQNVKITTLLDLEFARHVAADRQAL